MADTKEQEPKPAGAAAPRGEEHPQQAPKGQKKEKKGKKGPEAPAPSPEAHGPPPEPAPPPRLHAYYEQKVRAKLAQLASQSETDRAPLLEGLPEQGAAIGAEPGETGSSRENHTDVAPWPGSSRPSTS